MIQPAGDRHQKFLDAVRAFNKYIFNPITLMFAESRIGPFSVITHQGRRSGRKYRTPVLATYVYLLTIIQNIQFLACHCETSVVRFLQLVEAISVKVKERLLQSQRTLLRNDKFFSVSNYTYVGNLVIIPLSYGENVDWLRNILANGGCEITRQNKSMCATDPLVLGAQMAFTLLPESRGKLFSRFKVEKFVRLQIIG